MATPPKGEKHIKEYYDELNPDMEYKEFSQICKAPFLHLRRQMASDDLPEIRLMYLGTFRIHPGTILKMLKFNERRLQKGNITKQQYDYYVNRLHQYIRNNKEDFVKDKYKKTLDEWKICL